MAAAEQHISVPRTARYYTLGAEGSREMWLVLHGYGQLARYFLHHFEGLEEGRLIVAPEGLSRFYLDGSFGRVGASWMTREDRETEIADQITYLDALAARVSGKAALPVNVLGFSQGVATACRWAAMGRTRIQRIVVWGGSMPPELGQDPTAHPWRECRFDLVHGKADTVVGADVLERNAALLRSTSVPFTVHEHDGGHTLDRLLLGRLLGTDR
ncbi:MAG: phospholipase [Flavobacteriales bacterium]|nr:MAG: phospholipase [Flavobacteriales bacterium]